MLLFYQQTLSSACRFLWQCATLSRVVFAMDLEINHVTSHRKQCKSPSLLKTDGGGCLRQPASVNRLATEAVVV